MLADVSCAAGDVMATDVPGCAVACEAGPATGGGSRAKKVSWSSDCAAAECSEEQCAPEVVTEEQGAPEVVTSSAPAVSTDGDEQGTAGQGLDGMASCPESDVEVSISIDCVASDGGAEQGVAGEKLPSMVPCSDHSALASALLGSQRLCGVVKSYDVDAGFGFAKCEEVLHFFAWDVSLHREDVGTLEISTGAVISFALHLSKKGKPQAHHIRVEDCSLSAAREAQASTSIAEAQTAVADAGEEQGAAGQGLLNVAPCLDPSFLASVLLGSRRLCAVVKSYGIVAGFGFATCEEAQQLFGCDVYFHCEDVGTLAVTPGSTISFALRLSRKGKPQAYNLRVENGAAGGEQIMLRPDDAVAKPFWSGTFSGTVKSFDGDMGYGFVACDELHKEFNRDVFVHHSKLFGAKVGAAVRFKIVIDPVKGLPKVRELVVVDSERQMSGDAATIKPPPPSLESRHKNAPRSSSATIKPRSEENPWHSWRGTKSKEAVEVPTPTLATTPMAICFQKKEALASSLPSKCSNGPEPSPAPGSASLASSLPSKCSDGPEPSPAPGSASTWQQYCTEEGGGPWWFCEADGDWFLEESPGPWTKYSDPLFGRHYWWKDASKWFWV